MTSSRLKSQRWKIETLTFSLPHILSYYLTEIFFLTLLQRILYIILSLPFTKWKTNEMKKIFPVIKFVTSILQSFSFILSSLFMCTFPICSDNFSLYLSQFQTQIIINKSNIFTVQIFIEMPLNMLRNRINLILIKIMVKFICKDTSRREKEKQI